MDIAKFDLKLVEIHLKPGKVVTGTINTKANIMGFENVVPFITAENNEHLNEQVGNEKNSRIYIGITREQIMKFFDFIPMDEITEIKLIETEIHTLRLITQNGKEVQIHGFQAEIRNANKPGHISIRFKSPNSDKYFDVRNLPIKNGVVDVELSVAFISYAREDEKTVRGIVVELNDYGVVTWFDKNSLLPGSNWEIDVEKNIEKADYFLIFLSKETQDKIGYKNKELQLALKYQAYRPEGKIFIIPILLDDCDLPHNLRNLNWLKVSEEGWFNKLLSVVTPWYVKQNQFLR
ncbi:MAG: toll/interleukin-1 receptor domain-containing protein [Chloroflexi bacterium]|nr:toll/interleukin-1 receptor domain-containing protein [Chloroflexota bacterium]